MKHVIIVIQCRYSWGIISANGRAYWSVRESGMIHGKTAVTHVQPTAPMRSFNTVGPIIPEDHYHIPPLARVPLDRWCKRVERMQYFVLHALPQSGKTSALIAFRDHLNSGAAGEYRCLYVSAHGASAECDDIERATNIVLAELADQEERILGERLLAGLCRDAVEQSVSLCALTRALSKWAKASPQPVVLLIDEIDALVGVSLESMLHQLRTGHTDRPEHFPQSVVLCGLRRVQDYPLDHTIPFNIVAESFRLGDFSPEEAAALLGQHTAETGQAYAPEVVAAIWEYTQGQPWLVNALAAEVCARRDADRALQGVIGMQEMRDAKEALLLRRDTHLSWLLDQLRKDGVRRIINWVLTGDKYPWDCEDEWQYVRDVGLITVDGPPRMANPIYQEAVVRELSGALP